MSVPSLTFFLWLQCRQRTRSECLKRRRAALQIAGTASSGASGGGSRTTGFFPFALSLAFRGHLIGLSVTCFLNQQVCLMPYRCIDLHYWTHTRCLADMGSPMLLILVLLMLCPAAPESVVLTHCLQGAGK